MMSYLSNTLGEILSITKVASQSGSSLVINPSSNRFHQNIISLTCLFSAPSNTCPFILQRWPKNSDQIAIKPP